MKAKLTLRLDEELIHQAKEISAQQGKSVSKMVEDFFSLLSSTKTDQKYTASVKVLKGMLKDKDVDQDDYRKHLAEKFL